jgi:putative photosynthetic complex assembly protein
MTYVSASAQFANGQAPRNLTREQAIRERQAWLMIRLVFAIAGLALLLTILATFTGIGTERVVRGAPVSVAAITIIEQPDHRLIMAHAPAGAVIAEYGPAKGGFLRGFLRAFALKRDAAHVPATAPFEITRWESGRITLTDTATGHRIPVDTFGPGVTRAFAPLVGQAQTQGN